MEIGKAREGLGANGPFEVHRARKANVDVQQKLYVFCH